MSNLSYLEKLLDGVDVEWKSFGEIAKIQRGASPRPIAKFITDDEDGVPWIKIGDTESGSKYVEQTAQKITKEGATKSRVLKKGDFIISNSMSFGRPYILNITGAIHDGWASISEFGDKLNSDFLYHYLSSQSVQNYWISKINSGSVSNLNADIIKTLPVPIPCPNNPEKSLAIQDEIARILDAFTAMTAELTAELNMRKKQYNYYRDQLLSFEEGDVEWKNLEDVASFRRGSFPQPYGNSEWYDGEGCMPFVQVADLADFGFVLHKSTKQQISKLAQPKSVYVEKGTVIVSLQGTIGRVAITQYDCYVDRTLAIFNSFKVDINKKYFAHQLKAKFDLEKEFARGSTLKTITKEEFSKFQIPLPPIEEQNRIVSLLDKFDKLTHSIKEGLPREIELRQKQYEYYRDLLLSFPKSEEVTA